MNSRKSETDMPRWAAPERKKAQRAKAVGGWADSPTSMTSDAEPLTIADANVETEAAQPPEVAREPDAKVEANAAEEDADDDD
eukprot:6444937-Prymnesium_polylepis.1